MGTKSGKIFQSKGRLKQEEGGVREGGCPIYLRKAFFFPFKSFSIIQQLQINNGADY
jgi:hypothetical protein